MERGRDGSAENRQDSSDAIDGVDHIRGGLAEDGKEHGTLTAEKAQVAGVRDGIDDFADIPEPNGSARMASDDKRHVLVGFEELVGIADIPRFVGVRERSLCQIGVGGLQRTTNGFETDAVAVELVEIGFNPNGGTRASPSEDLADPLHLSELLSQDGIGGVIDLSWRNIVRG